MSESIYNIIPKQQIVKPKGTLYKSKYPPNLPPTGTTFGLTTTSKPIGANLNGEYSYGLQAHTEYGGSKTFGHLKGDRKPQPDGFLKKHTGTMGNQTLPPVRKFSYDSKHKKDPVPRVHQKPIQGLNSGKNFIATNAVQAILSNAKKTPQQVNWLKKKDFGRNPQYLQKVKQNVTNQYKMIQTLHMQNQKSNQCLSQQQVYQIKQGLKKKWNQINHEYQKLTHNRIIDTVGKKGRKEACEKQLSQIQADIKKLNKNYVFLDD